MAEEKIIRIFISSTFEDFEKERNSVKKAIEEARLTMASHGIFLQAIDLQSSARPNPPIEECLKEVATSQVLIGLIGARYGSTHPLTGKSISELEYDKAIECNIPPLMYIRNFNEDRWTEKDPDSMKKLSFFRQKVESKHMRDTFDSCDAIRGHVLRDLPPCITEKYGISVNKTSDKQAVESPKTPLKEIASEEVSQIKEVSSNVKEISDLLKFINDNIKDINNIDGQKKVRLFLLASSMFYDTELYETLGVHEIQKIYKIRKNIKTIIKEKEFLIKNAISDAYNVKAGWFWGEKVKSKAMLDYIKWLYINDYNEDIKIGCLRLLKNFWSDRIEIIITKNCFYHHKKVYLEALKILEEFGTEQCLDVLKKTVPDKDIEIQRSMTRTKLAIYSRCNQLKAASLIEEMENEYAIGDVSSLSNILTKMDIIGLKKLKDHKNNEIKRYVIIELAKRNELNDNELNNLIDDNNDDMRYWGYRSLIANGKKFNLEEVKKIRGVQRQSYLLDWYFPSQDRFDEIKIEILNTYPIDELTANLQWLNTERELIYLVIGLRKGQEGVKQVRVDLENKFARIKDDYQKMLDGLKVQFEKLNDQINLKIVLNLLNDFKKDNAFGENAFTKSALNILIKYGEQEDIKYAKKFMESKDPSTKELGAKLFITLSTKDDISTLVNIALNSAGDICSEACQKALALSDNNFNIETLLESNNFIIIKLCLKESLSRGYYIKKEKIEKLMLHTNEDVRVITVAYLMKALKKKQAKLKNILDKYLENQTYYYNVVCWLDRIIYAPQIFKKLYRNQLLTKLD